MNYMEKMRELNEERKKCIHDMRALNDKVEKEGRDFNAEEQEQYDKLFKRAGELKDEMKSLEARERRERELAAMDDDVIVAGSGAMSNRDDDGTRGAEDKEAREQRDARYLSGTREERRAHAIRDPRVEDLPQRARERYLIGGLRMTEAYELAWRNWLMLGGLGIGEETRNMLQRGIDQGEVRALQADLDVAGGFLYPSEQFVARLIQEKDNILFIRQRANIITITGSDAIGVPELENDPADADWTAEIKTGTEDSSMNFGKRQMRTHPLAKRIKVAKKLVRLAAIGIEGLIRERLAYKLALSEEKAFLVGTGSSQPLGIFTASNSGITTARDVSTGNTTTAIKADNLRECKYTLKAQYRRNARWCFHKDAIKRISKLKDGEGNYLWRQGLREGDPDTLLGYPIDESEYAPNTFTTGKYVGALGDWSQYWIIESLGMTVQVLTELYAESNQNGYIARAEIDGAPIDELAWVRVTLA